MSPQSEETDLLAGAEDLSAVTAGQYSEATGEEVLSPASDSATLAVQAEESVNILCVRKDGMSTEELIRQLLHDPRVLSAEPNYLMQFEDDSRATTVSGDGRQGQTLVTTLGDGPGRTTGETTCDLTQYQWFSVGVAGNVPQYPFNATNPGIQVPHWNDARQKNADGVVAIMDSGVDYTHPDLAGVMYRFSETQQKELGCGEFIQRG